MQLSHVNLIDVYEGIGDAWNAHHRPFGSPVQHGISGAENVFWNIESDEEHVVWTSQWGVGRVIGTRGPGTVRTDPAYGIAGEPADEVEGVGLGEYLRPWSLYQYQLTGERYPALSAKNWERYK